jgi:hypothetical protein
MNWGSSDKNIGLAALFWLGMMAALLIRRGNELTDGLWDLLAGLCLLILWAALAQLTLATARSRGLTWQTGAVPLLVFGVAAIGALAALQLHDRGAGWALGVLAVLPIIVAFHAILPNPWLAAAVVLLSAPPIFLATTQPRRLQHVDGHSVSFPVAQTALISRHDLL